MNSRILTALLAAASLCAETVELNDLDVNAPAEEEPVLEERISLKSSKLAEEARGETLGDFLQNEQFVDSASYGPAVGRPVVRGMDGYRVGITNGNIALNDLSAMSQDHAVGVMARASERIEMLKGPASLLYGNYSGGVIRVLGEEHDPDLLPEGWSVNTTSVYGTNGAGLVLGGTVKLSEYNLSLFAGSDYLDAPSYHDGDGNEIANSDSISLDSHLVLGYRIDTDNIIKAYYDRLKKDYGIPNSTAERTSIDMHQERYGLVWHSADILGARTLTEIEYSDYLHSELEGESHDGLFGQTQLGLSTLFDFNLDDWNTVTNLGYRQSDLQVCHEHGKCTHFYDAERTGTHVGEELLDNIAAFGLPFSHGHPMPDIHEQLFQAGTELKRYDDDDHEITLSARAEYRILDPDSSNIQEVWLVTPAVDPGYYDARYDTALSLSAGWFSYVSDAVSLQTSLGYIERLPSSTEIFWNGFHHATDSYIFGDRYIGNERSVNFDIDALLTQGDFSTTFGGFYYHYFNYIYQAPLADANGTVMTDPFHNSDVWAIRGAKARIFGVSLSEAYSHRIGTHQIGAEAGIEAIRGMLIDGGNLPRIPTLRTTLSLKYAKGGFKSNLAYQYVDGSRFDAENETHTPGYSWVSLLLSYGKKMKMLEYLFYLKGENLGNAMAYNHLSFLKETAPLPGRQLSAGLELTF